jgi:mannose-6-phosphate isomerase-like protein (cupin superfamily)
MEIGMRAYPLMAVVLISASVTYAQQSPATVGVKVWPKGMPPQGISEKDDYGDHILSVSHREKDGVVEVHESKDDVMIVQSGEATFVYGGRGIGMHASAPGEQQGERIEGGTSIHLGPGDVITVPAGVPHQYFVPKGGQITYTLVKIVKH